MGGKMKNGKYKDFYAQIRKEAGDRELIYFWINNLLPGCFRQQEDSNYCLDGECEYLGLKIQYHIVLSTELYKKLPHIRIPFPIVKCSDFIRFQHVNHEIHIAHILYMMACIALKNFK